MKPNRYPPTLVRRLIDEAVRTARTPFLGSVVGQLHLDNKVPLELVSTALEWAEFVGRYDRLFSNPSRTIKSPDYQRGRAGDGTEPDKVCRDCDCGGDLTECGARTRARREWASAEAAIGKRSWNVVYGAVLHNHRPVSHEEVLLLVEGLRGLAYHYGHLRRAA